MRLFTSNSRCGNATPSQCPPTPTYHILSPHSSQLEGKVSNNVHRRARAPRLLAPTVFTVHLLARRHRTTFVKAISGRRWRSTDNNTHVSASCSSTSVFSPRPVAPSPRRDNARHPAPPCFFQTYYPFCLPVSTFPDAPTRCPHVAPRTHK